MSLEIERKFLCKLTREEAASLAFNYRYIKSVYLENKETSSVRVVRDTMKNGDILCKATEKISTEKSISRIENESDIPVQIFNALDTNTYPSVSKQRFLITDNDNVWEVDFFDNYDFVIAELEFQSEEDATSFTTLPSWVGKEVTDDPFYLNCNLARLI